MDTPTNKPRRGRADREEIGGQLMSESIIGEIDRLDAIAQQATQAADILKGVIDQAGHTKLTVDIEPLKEHSDKLTRELRKQVQHVMQPPIVLKVIIGLAFVSFLATWAAGYYIRESRAWEERATYWYEQHQNLQIEMQAEKPAKKK